jgi:PTS system mannose-specific IID component
VKTALPRRALASACARSFLIQGSWNHKTMLGSGFAFAMHPALKFLFRGDPPGLEAALRRHLEHFNAHPYLASVALGAALRMEADGEDPDDVRRFKTAVRGPLGGLGDALVWGAWLPAASLAALALLWLGAPAWSAILLFLVGYNLGHLGLRAWGFATGLAGGRGVARSLGAAELSRWTERVRSLGGFLLGLFCGAVLIGRGGLAEAGLPWAVLACAGFVGGTLVGHRLWRPAAVAVVAAVALLAGWGLAP